MKGLCKEQVDLLRMIKTNGEPDIQGWCGITGLLPQKSNSARASLSRSIKRLRNRDLVVTDYDQSGYRLRIRLTKEAVELLAIIDSLESR